MYLVECLNIFKELSHLGRYVCNLLYVYTVNTVGCSHRERRVEREFFGPDLK